MATCIIVRFYSTQSYWLNLLLCYLSSFIVQSVYVSYTDAASEKALSIIENYQFLISGWALQKCFVFVVNGLHRWEKWLEIILVFSSRVVLIIKKVICLCRTVRWARLVLFKSPSVIIIYDGNQIMLISFRFIFYHIHSSRDPWWKQHIDCCQPIHCFSFCWVSRSR